MRFTGLELSQQVRDRARFIAKLKPKDTVLAQECFNTISDLSEDKPLTDMLDAVHRLQRFYIVGQLGLIDDPKTVEALKDPRFITYKDFAVLPTTEQKREALAKGMYQGDPENRQPIYLVASDYSRGIVEKTLQYALNDKAAVNPWIPDPLFHRRILSVCDSDQVKKYAEIEGGYWLTAQRRLDYRVNSPSVAFVDPPQDEKNAEFSKHLDKTIAPMHSNQFYTLTLLPTENDAKRDGMTHQEFIDLFFDMCDLDWKKMSEAQKIVIAKLNAGSILRFTNDDGTDVSMDISGFTFANSLVAKNIPGSEVFSAPHKTSVNGKIVAKGNFASPLDRSQVIKDITLEFKDGKVVNFDAVENRHILQKYIESDHDSCYTGEIGIGMNPKLRRHVINGLMVEKIGGSFHMALGHSYKYKDYLGEPVNVDNGNTSGPHWDITTMLFGKNGKIILDNEVLFENDRWLDPQLKYLNMTA